MNSRDLAAPELTKQLSLQKDLPRGSWSLLHGSAPSYDDAKVWDGMIGCKPLFIVRCAIAPMPRPPSTLRRDNGPAVAVRGGGHNIAGNAVCEGGLVIDFLNRGPAAGRGEQPAPGRSQGQRLRT